VPAAETGAEDATRAEAERALDKVAARNEGWDNDPRWNDELED